jgi:glutamyl-tRNA synthetase
VTHALRTSEYKDREAQYIWIQKLMGVRKARFLDFTPTAPKF